MRPTPVIAKDENAPFDISHIQIFKRKPSTEVTEFYARNPKLAPRDDYWPDEEVK